jgi:hypothetical protein
VKALLVTALVGSLGCDYLSKRSDRQELDGLNLYIDLEIARVDEIAIRVAKMNSVSARENLGKALDRKSPADDKAMAYLNDRVEKTDEELAKALETAARHRHR